MMNQANLASVAWDVLVVGAGAAGLLAAAASAERGHRTLLLEKNRKAGVKILMSGGTRCNLTHACDRNGILAAFGSAGPFLHSALAALGPEELVELFHSEGLATKVEEGGKVFPASDRAVDVLHALLARLRRSGAELALAEPVNAIVPVSEGFKIKSAVRELTAAKLIVTTGGKSYPGCGTTGDGYAWLANLGHTIRRPRPALVPLTTDDGGLHALSGLTISDVRARIVEPHAIVEAGKHRRSRLPPGVKIERRGGLLFTHFGLSGPVAMDVSRAVTAAKSPRDVVLRLDFLPDEPATSLESSWQQAIAADGRKQVLSLISTILPRRLAETLLQRAGIAPERRGAEWPKQERAQLLAQIKNCEVRLTGTRGFDKAEVTAGGVALDEVDSSTMESKLVPNLYLAGEILDLDGFIGGYNFQAAFSTGYLAGSSV